MLSIIVTAVLLAGCAGSSPPSQPEEGSRPSPPVPSSTAAGLDSTPAQPQPPTDSFTGTASDSWAHRAAHTANVLLDGRVLVAGGCVNDGCGDATAETVLIASDGQAVKSGPEMSDQRDSHTASRLPDGRVLIVGGFAGEGRPPLASFDIFDPLTDRFNASGNIALGRGGHIAVPLDDGRVLVAGGWVARRTYTDTVELIDPGTGVVESAASLPLAVDALAAVALGDGRVLVAGGQVEPGLATNAAAIFDPVTGVWIEVESLLQARFKHTMALLPDGQVLVIGGTTDDRELLATTELFDPTTGTFTPGPLLQEPRYKLAGGAVVLPENQVLVAGGGTTVEIIDLDSGVSRTVDDSFVQRGSFATASYLAEQARILIVGGYDDSIALRREHLLLSIP